LTLTLLEHGRKLGWYKKHNVASGDLQRHDEKKLKRASRRAYTPEEIRAIFRALPSLPVPVVVKEYIVALFEVGQRREELATMKWIDLDLDEGWWAMPKATTKNKNGVHRVPLSKDLVQLLRARKQLTERFVAGVGVSAHVRRKQRQAPEKYAGIYVFWNRTPATSIVESLSRYATVINTHFAGSFKLEYHNTRRTVATQGVAAEIGVHEIGLVLNHSTGRQSLTGNRQTDEYVEEYAYDGPKGAAMKKWAKRLKTFKPTTLRLVQPA
jgi:integrase